MQDVMVTRIASPRATASGGNVIWLASIGRKRRYEIGRYVYMRA
jgi:hypothetical protein